MSLLKNVSNSTVIISKHSILPEAVFSDERYGDKEKESVKKFVKLGYFVAVEEEKVVEEATPVTEEVTTTKKKSSKARG